MTHTDVLIVGGGPSGLMAASLLSIYGVDFRLIDKKAGISGNSRALSIHARTLELFEQMGVVEDFLAQGRPVRGITLAEAGRRTDFDVFTAGGDITHYNMSLILEQNKTERLLLDFVERAGHALAWETALTELTQTEDGVRVELEGADGSGETVHARYVLAADGASSTVRKSVDVAFTGDTVEQRFLVMDATVNQDFDDGTMTLNLNANGPIALIPLTVDGRFRIISTLPVGFEGEDPTAQDYADFLRDHFPGGLDVSDYKWFSPYRIHSRSVQHFRVGNVLFIGDAAHVHTPVGGQGMNTGLQDAHNLVWKLALVLRGGLPQTALDSYDTERHPVAKRLLDTTDRLFQAASQGGAVARFIRGYLFTPVLRSIAGWEMMQRRWFPTMAMTGIGYDEGLLVKDDGRGVPHRAPAPGERWPYIEPGLSGRQSQQLRDARLRKAPSLRLRAQRKRRAARPGRGRRAEPAGRRAFRHERGAATLGPR